MNINLVTTNGEIYQTTLTCGSKTRIEANSGQMWLMLENWNRGIETLIFSRSSQTSWIHTNQTQVRIAVEKLKYSCRIRETNRAGCRNSFHQGLASVHYPKPILATVIKSYTSHKTINTVTVAVLLEVIRKSIQSKRIEKILKVQIGLRHRFSRKPNLLSSNLKLPHHLVPIS